MEYLPNLVTGITTLVIGFLWYGPMTFQNAWMKAANVTEDDMKKSNMALIFGLAFLLAFVISLPIDFVCGLHQDAKDINFMHGALHGVMLVAMVGIPVLVTNALFDRRGWKYMLINAGYWLVVSAVMGGILMIWNPA